MRDIGLLGLLMDEIGQEPRYGAASTVHTLDRETLDREPRFESDSHFARTCAKR